MEIKYLKELSKYPTLSSKNSDYVRVLKPLTETEISSLENTYNNGNPFPTALRELLFLAGNDCHVLDYGLNDSQEEMQEDARRRLVKRNKSIVRPFFVIDVYSANSQFLFVYLDEGEDPLVREAVFGFDPANWLRTLKRTLSGYIDALLIELLNGRNPF